MIFKQHQLIELMISRVYQLIMIKWMIYSHQASYNILQTGKREDGYPKGFRIISVVSLSPESDNRLKLIVWATGGSSPQTWHWGCSRCDSCQWCSRTCWYHCDSEMIPLDSHTRTGHCSSPGGTCRCPWWSRYSSVPRSSPAILDCDWSVLMNTELWLVNSPQLFLTLSLSLIGTCSRVSPPDQCSMRQWSCQTSDLHCPPALSWHPWLHLVRNSDDTEHEHDDHQETMTNAHLVEWWSRWSVEKEDEW